MPNSRLLFCFLFPLNNSGISLHSPLACEISEKSYAVLCASVKKVFFPSDFFHNFFSLSLIFCNLNMIYLGVVLWHLFWRGILGYPGSVVWYLMFSCSVTQSCPTLCNPMDCSTPGFPVLHHLSEFAHVHWVSDAIQQSCPLSSPSPPTFNPSQHQGLFQWAGSSHQVAKVLELQLQHQSFQWILRIDFF